MAAGIGQTDGEDHQTADRDADGRRAWEIPPQKNAEGDPADEPPQVKDPSGQSGGTIDLSG
jgi:hypothetical protein